MIDERRRGKVADLTTCPAGGRGGGGTREAAAASEVLLRAK